MNAIPTLYKGVQFRSRLEARWAAMFDWWDWPWLYEPLDLAGYIPDFILNFRDGAMPVLVEIKPELTLDGLDQHISRIDASGWRGEAKLLGCHPLHGERRLEKDKDGYSIIGISRPVDRPLARWDECILFACEACEVRGTVSLLVLPDGAKSGHACARCGATGKIAASYSDRNVKFAWNAAGNATQWRASRSRYAGAQP